MWKGSDKKVEECLRMDQEVHTSSGCVVVRKVFVDGRVGPC